MSKKRYFDTNFWSDTWVETLTREEKLFFIYLFTNERVSIAGVYEIPLKRMAIETDFDKTEIMSMLTKMESRAKYINGWVVLRNAIKSQNYKNDKIQKGIKAILESCPVELLQFVSFPQDFGVLVERSESEPKQQGLFDDTSMSLDDSPMRHDKYNIIKYNINTNTKQPDKPPAGSSKELSKSQKRQYAIAMEKEREQEARVDRSYTRKPSKPQPIDQDEIEKAYRRREHKR